MNMKANVSVTPPTTQVGPLSAVSVLSALTYRNEDVDLMLLSGVSHHCAT